MNGCKDGGNKDVSKADMESKECGGRTVKEGGGGRLIEGEGKCRTVGELKHCRVASSHQLKGCDPRSPGKSCCCGIQAPTRFMRPLTDGHTQASLLFVTCMYLFLCQ